MDFQTIIQNQKTIINFQKFILDKYNISINVSILENQLKKIDIEKLSILNTHFQLIFGLNFQDLLEISIKTSQNESFNNQNLNSLSNLLINKYLIKINEKDKKICNLREANEDLRTNYWNLKQSTIKNK